MQKNRLKELQEMECFKDILTEDNIELIEDLIQVMYKMTDEHARTFCLMYSNFAAETPTELLVYACNNYKTLPEDRAEKAVKATHNMWNKLIMQAMADEGL